VLAGVIGQTVFATRMVRVHLGNTECRLAAQSAIEMAKTAIRADFTAYAHSAEGRIGVMSGDVFKWFDRLASPYIFSNGFEIPFRDRDLNGCQVELKLKGAPVLQTKTVESSTSGSKTTTYVVLSLIARATRANIGAPSSSLTILERFSFASDNSSVFKNAYFVNNFGWFQGSGCTANGDVRANGDMRVDSGCTVNGNIYAAANEELGSLGVLLDSNGNLCYGQMQAFSAYNSGASSRTRPTKKNADGVITWMDGYDAPSKLVTTTGRESTMLRCYASNVNNGNWNDIVAKGIEMPYISDLSIYKEYARQKGGTLTYTEYTKTASGSLKAGSRKTVNAVYTGTGPSGDAALADNGALVLYGTQTSPIVVNGPVVIPSDIILKGYVKGQGTIYCGRNIHVVGNVQYVDSPSWSHPNSVNPQSEYNANAGKDLVAYMAKGNIVFGNYADSGSSSRYGGSSSWYSDISPYISRTPYVQEYICDESDQDIGYPRVARGETKFCGDYTQSDGGQRVTTSTTSTRSGWGYTTTYTYVNGSRKYYQSVCDEKIISSLYSSSITRFDGVLYNNHGIFGRLGACTFNGSLICRNEGLIYSDSLVLNWDIRLSRASIGLPQEIKKEPAVLLWRELPSTYYDK